MAISLERLYAKAEILEAYMNEIFLGQDGNRAIHGFGLGSRFFFGKSLRDLSLAESATLVGMVKAPSAYNPRRHRVAAKKRRNLVLNLLFEHGVISRQEYADAKAVDVVARGRSTIRRRDVGAFIDLVRVQLKRDYRQEDLDSAGLNIYTTLDLRVQQAAQHAASVAVGEVEERKNIDRKSLQTALVVIDPRTAEVKSLLGGRAGSQTGFNRALNARRPIGSLVKPFVYLAALEQTERFNVLSILEDEAVSLTAANGEIWAPKNYDGTYHGKVSLRQALIKSYNLATVNLGLEVGVKTVRRRLQALGLERDLGDFPSLLLGAIDLSPVEVTQLYQGIANDGFKVPLRAIRSVADAQNRTLTRYPPRVEQVIDATTAYLVQYLLTGVVAEGTARAVATALNSRLPLAGKTGTSNDGRDSWFAGFGGNYLAVVWVGRDDNGRTGLTGASGALRIWTDLMRQTGITPFRFGRPEHIQWLWATPTGDAIVAENCSGAKRIPLAVPHGLPEHADCEPGGPADRKIWDRIRGLFR